MQRQKSIKTLEMKGPVAGSGNSDLLHHVDAISLALKNWNDLETLKLLRLHWPEIACAIRRPDLPEGIAVPVLQPDAAPNAHDRISQFDEVLDGPADDDGRKPTPRLRTVP